MTGQTTNSLTNRRYLDGGVGASIANRGTGKTMSAVYLALLECIYDPYLEIYGNVKINHPRAHYTPFLFLPFEKIYNAILIIDDASKIENIRRYAKVVSNITRKLKLDILFTGQDPKHVPKRIRGQLNYRIRPYLDKKKDILSVRIQYDDGKTKWHNFKNAIERNKRYDIYDTQEIPPFVLKHDAIREIAKISSTPYEIERNLMLFSGDKKEHKQMKKEILNHPKYQGKKNINDDKKSDAAAKLLKLDIINELKQKHPIRDKDWAPIFNFRRREANRELNDYLDKRKKAKKDILKSPSISNRLTECKYTE
ncbi:MAG: hypothetical protein ACOC1X_00030 [Promethearchaeota archaeon]